MAVTAIGRTIVMTAASDTLNQATLGHTGALAPYRVHASAIAINAGATGGTTTLKNGGTSGNIIYSLTTPANTYTMIMGSDPLQLDDFFVTAVGTNVTIIVYLA